jgi:hypothetical protein
MRALRIAKSRLLKKKLWNSTPGSLVGGRQPCKAFFLLSTPFAYIYVADMLLYFCDAVRMLSTF